MKTKFTVKQILAVVLSLLMVLAVSIPAFAEEPTTYSITINNADGLADMVNGQFTAYYIFTGAVGTVTGTGNGTTGTMTDVAWADATAGANLLAALKGTTVDADVTAALKEAFKDATTAIHVAEVLESKAGDAAFLQAFAKVAKKYLTAAGTSTTDGDTYTISGLAAGYYLVVQNSDIQDENGKDGIRSSFILQVVNKNVEVDLKADIPTVEKAVSDTSAGIGDIVKFTLTATLPNNFTDYAKYFLQFNDTLSDGLELVIDASHPLTVAIDDDALVNGSTPETTYYSTTAVNAKEDKDFTVTFTDLRDDKFDGMVDNESVITVTYYAKVLTTAANIENNKVDLTYSNDPNTTGTGTTVEDIVYVHNYNVEVTKKGTDGKDLTGAKFYLTNAAGEYATADANGKITGWVAKTDDKVPATAATFTSNNGKFTITGLDAGKFTLIEYEAAKGYGTIDNVTFTITAVISEDGATVTSVTVAIDGGDTANAAVGNDSNEKDHTVYLGLVDPTDSNLPNTGGIGTTIFYILGGLMVIGAAAYLVISKKKSRA
ncbi:MAG: LPXTG cell wall anchor domain-containing protein [Oscillospiraceae bacterium]|nr:LPXTG cell wall anchor domain-containing protein [Oscillospiraceae bacterium]